MIKHDNISFQRSDYAQSANALFHFMNNGEYLKWILMNRAIVPRYCMENIEYLNIHVGDVEFKEVAILQKCFCDIPFHKLTDTSELKGIGEVYESLTNEEKAKLEKGNTHPDCYGEFSIAFSKDWGENKNLQPVHYLNEESQYTAEYIKLLKSTLDKSDIPDEYTNDILNRLAFIKPLRGVMKRPFKRKGLENCSVELYKNFHDEQEWRYVPNSMISTEAKVENIIANPKLLSFRNMDGINNSLMAERYKSLWLEYDYNDIRYIIVPHLNARIDIINTIMAIPDDKLDDQAPSSMQKYILISKILVLSEIRKDW